MFLPSPVLLLKIEGFEKENLWWTVVVSCFGVNTLYFDFGTYEVGSGKLPKPRLQDRLVSKTSMSNITQ